MASYNIGDYELDDLNEEEEPQMVYVVTSGDYSEYHIEAVFLTYGQATKYIELHLQDGWYYGFQIEEYEINRSMPKTDNLMWSVSYKGRRWTADRSDETFVKRPILDVSETQFPSRKYYEFYMTVFAKDKEHALKIARDTYAKAKAEREDL